MTTLFFRGTLGDSISVTFVEIWDEKSVIAYIFMVVCLIYVFLAMFTILNMLIGILCEVVSAVSEAAKEEAVVDNLRETLLGILEQFDEDGNQSVSKDEFELLIKDPEAVKALESKDEFELLIKDPEAV